MDFITRIKEGIGNFIQKGDKIIVGVSGGPDSTALLHLLASFKKEYRLTLHVAHFNHRLRGKASEADVVFVKKLADSYGLDFIKAESDTKAVAARLKGGLEKVARDERYIFFIKTALTFGATKIALAHTKDEDIETILFRFIKGAGAHGLSGIPDVRKVYDGEYGIHGLPADLYIIRPLLYEYKADILAHFRKQGMKFRTDASNEKNLYARNKIRNILIPLIEKEFNPNFKENISNMAAILDAENDYFEMITEKIAGREIRRDAEDVISISLRSMKKMHPAVRSRVIMTALQGILQHHRKIKFQLIKSIEALLSGKKNVALPEKFDCCVENGRLVFARKQPPPEKEKPILIESIAGVDAYEFGGKKLRLSVITNTGKLNLKNKNKAYIDSEKVKFPLFIRRRKEGDRFVPYGMKEPVKIKKFINTAKLKTGPVIVTDKTRVMWIAGERLDDRFKVTTDTRRILLIELV
jgi:tRNA(Ile)-lysidine synthase